ncbi:MAG: HAD family phosphatase [Anaerolineales bacterium]|nr:HAD family phosphatase [Anaerolineales bacterium]
MIRAVFFDLGGVILRTEFDSPRHHLAEKLGVEYEDLLRAVFQSESCQLASLGRIKADEHWLNVTRLLKRPASDVDLIRSEFFAGDVIDRTLLDFIRSLKPRYKTGLLSNAWSDLREYTRINKFDDVFDGMTISAELGVVKPNEKVYQLALDQLDVRADESVFIDDFIENVEGARAVGMSAIHFKGVEGMMKELKKML